jgi:polysaccharide deacetylase family protein (PEP-CTERM system associated)
MMNALSFDVEEHFHVQGFADVIAPNDWDRFPSRVVENTQRILRLLREFDVRATFFILGWVAERQPRLVQEIADDGHEIASHGYAHQLVYRQSPQEFSVDIARSLDVIGHACPTAQVRGYRAPSFSIVRESEWAFDELSRVGFAYDSSVFPISGHDRYGIPNASRSASLVRDRLLEVPLSTVRFAGRNWPVAGGGYFRLFPLWLTRRAVRSINAEGHPAVVYLHPWEFDPGQPRVSNAGRLSRFRHYVSLSKTEVRLRRLLQEFTFGPLGTVYAAQLETASAR